MRKKSWKKSKMDFEFNFKFAADINNDLQAKNPCWQ